MKKIIYVTPHLSTGGLPKYLLEKINKFKNDFDIFVIEYNNISNSYIVHRNEIINTITSTKYFCLDEDTTHLKFERRVFQAFFWIYSHSRLSHSICSPWKLSFKIRII